MGNVSFMFRWLPIPFFMSVTIAIIYLIDSSHNVINKVSPSSDSYDMVAYGGTKQLSLEDIGHESKKAMLIIKQHPRSISVLTGSRVIFESGFVTDGDATYLWKRVDDVKLDVGRTSGINSKRLTIRNVIPSDAGSYVCVTSKKDADIVSDKVILYVKKVSCPSNLVISNGNIQFSEDGRSVTYQCADKFELVGAASAKCKQDGTWSSPPPNCIAPCPTDLVIPAGNAKFSEDGRSVTYQCADTFKLVGPASAECKQDGTWSSPLPKCILCPTDLAIPDGNVKFSEDGRSVTYQCADTFKLVGPASAKCKQDGTWSSPLPKCLSQDCQPNKNPGELTKTADRLATDQFKLHYVAKNCDEKFREYVSKMSSSTVDHLCQQFGISSLNSQQLQYDFMQCPGLTLYQFFMNSEGNIQVPKPFHNCKKMSFRDSGVPTMLVSFPGSGNSWVRQLLESTTGIYTGSVFCDLDYIKNGMIGEGIHSQNVLAIKYHFGKPPPLPFKKIIYIIRNPYDAIIAEYKRWYQSDRLTFKRTEVVSNPHTSDLPDQSFGGKEWVAYVKMLAVSWSQHVQLWLGPRTPNGATVLVVKYENLKTDLRTELKKMMSYLEYPVTEEDLDCTINSNTNTFRRHHDSSTDKEYFNQQQVDLIYYGIRRDDSILKKYNINYEKYKLKT